MQFNWRVASRHSSFQATAANTSADRRYMIIDVNKGEQSTNCERLKYPLIWLRDNCQCSTCFDAQSKSRTIDWTKFHFKNAHPKSITVSRSHEFLGYLFLHLISKVKLITNTMTHTHATFRSVSNQKLHGWMITCQIMTLSGYLKEASVLRIAHVILRITIDRSQNYGRKINSK